MNFKCVKVTHVNTPPYRRTIFTHLNIQLFKLHVKSFYYLKEKTCKNVDLPHNLKNGQHFFLTFLMTVLVSQFHSIWSFPIKKSRSPINFPPSFFHQTNQTTLPLLHLLPLSSHHSHGHRTSTATHLCLFLPWLMNSFRTYETFILSSLLICS